MAGLLAVAILVVTSLAKHAKASPKSYSDDYRHPDNGICVDYTITQELTSTNDVWGLDTFENNFDIAKVLSDIARKDSASTFHPISGSKNETKTYEVSATFCSPKKTIAGKEKTVLLATHGLGYDRRYWASSFKPESYSFVDFAIDKGYSVFYYDRLGTGKSQILSGYTNQLANQVAVQIGLVELIRAGKYTGAIGKPDNIVPVGHSYGSVISNTLVAARPDLVDGLVLTGTSYPNATDLAIYGQQWIPAAFAARVAKFQDNAWSDRDTGYLGFVDIYSHVTTFFYDYDVDAAEYAQSIAQPLAILEYLSTASPSPSAFQGPVMVTAGEHDLIACSGDCNSTFNAGGTEKAFKGSKNLELYLHPGSGHGVNFNLNATGFYGKIIDFLDKNF